jgi:hypothetical protein
MKRIKVLSLLAMMVIPVGVVYAGARSSVEVTITLDDTGNPVVAQGNEADAYNSADANQYIGCGGTSVFGWCQAHDATADVDGVVNAAFCSTDDPQLIAHIRSVAADSFVRFRIDPTTGDCVTISVSHNSFYRPKAP